MNPEPELEQHIRSIFHQRSDGDRVPKDGRDGRGHVVNTLPPVFEGDIELCERRRVQGLLTFRLRLEAGQVLIDMVGLRQPLAGEDPLSCERPDFVDDEACVIAGLSLDLGSDGLGIDTDVAV